LDVATKKDRPASAWAAPFDRSLALLPLVLTLLVYYPLTRNYFRADDFLYLYRIVNSDLLEYLIEPHGGHLLMARNLVFYLCFTAFGTWTPGYFWLVLLTHLLNVFLLFHAIRGFTGSRRLACLGAALWGTCPMQEGSLGWYAVYGHVMVGSIVCFLLFWSSQPEDGSRSGLRTGLLWTALLLVASTSFGVGLGLAMATPLAAPLLIRSSRSRRIVVVSSLLVACALPFLYAWLTARSARGGFESTPLLMSGFHHPAAVVGFLLQLIGDGVGGLLLGPLKLSGDSPALAYSLAVLVGVVAIAALIVAPWDSRKNLAGCLLVSAACYGSIAFGLASRTVFFGFVFAYKTRYQYAGSIALLVALCIAASQVTQRWRLSAAWKNCLLGAGLLWITGSHAIFGQPIDHHDDTRRQVDHVVSRIRSTIERTPVASDVYIENRRFSGIGPFLFASTDRFPGWAGLFVIVFPDNVVDGRRVFFVTSDGKALAGAADGKRTADLLIDPKRAEQRGWRPPPVPPPSQPRGLGNRP
jgi:hypothetical protein